MAGENLPGAGGGFLGGLTGAATGSTAVGTNPGSAASGAAAGAAGAASGGASLGAFSSIQNALSAFYDVLTNGKMWRSAGWLLLGVAFMITGVLLWIRPSAFPVPVPV